MAEALRVILAAAFTAAVSLSAGWLLLRRLRLSLYRIETALFSFVAGSACLSLLMFFQCLAHQARRGVIQWTGLALIVWAAIELRRTPGGKTFPKTPRFWISLFSLVVGAFFFVYFVMAVAPEASPDGMGYHLGNVTRLWKNHGFVWDYHSMYSYLSQGLELLFLVSFVFGRHSAAAMTHLTFLAALPLLMLSYGRRFDIPRAAIAGALFVFASPVVGLAGSSAYNDLGVATVLFAVFYLLQVWDESRDRKLLLLIGLLSGFAYAVKYTAALALPLAVGFVWWRSRRAGSENSPGRPLWDWAALLIPSVLMIAPWVLRNWIWLGNPVAPFLNALFPNPYYHPGMEEIYVDGLRHYTGIKHWWQVPLELTVRGGSTAGLLGPVFLLAPLALLALRSRQGRRLLFAALFFGLPAYLNTGARFLIPSLPFLSIAMAMGIPGPKFVLPAIALLNAVACWPNVLGTYCHPWAWRINRIPIQAALRYEPELEYVARRSNDPAIALKYAIEQNVPAGAKIFSCASRPEGRIDRTIITSYESTFGNLLFDIILTPPLRKPDERQRFRFLPLTTRSLRVLQTTKAKNVYWTVAEMRLYSQGRELPRSGSWRVSAGPNGWEAPLAFDNSYVTRWSTWQSIAPRDRLQVDFPTPTTLDEVALEGIRAWEAKLQVEALNPRGRWVPITDTFEYSKFETPPGLRRAAMLEFKARGIDYILAGEGDGMWQDMKMYPTYWGIKELAAGGGLHLYRIE